MQPRHLADLPDALPLVVELFVSEWSDHYGAGGPGDAVADLRASMNRDRLPLCVLALDDDGALVGTISIKAQSFSHPELSPWAAAFVVAPAARRRGIGSALVAEIEAEARRLGFDTLYMATGTAGALVERRGWRSFDVVDTPTGPVTLYAIDLREDRGASPIDRVVPGDG